MKGATMDKKLSLRMLLLVIAALLCVNLIITFLSNSVPSYAAKSFRYKIMSARDYTYKGEKGLQQMLDRYGNDGWDIAAVYGDVIIFKK
jgi:hypothetical protein